MGNFAENLNLGNRFRPPLRQRATDLTVEALDQCREPQERKTIKRS